MIVVPNEVAAYDIVKALKGLDDQGAIELYSATVVMKSDTGTLTVKQTHDTRGPWAAALGVSTGALLGLLAGPIGAVAGATIGGAAFLGGELAYSGFAGDFVHAVESKLQPGAYAVCASLWEDWTVPVDVATAPYGAIVFRQTTDDVVAAQIRADWQATKDELNHLESEMDTGSGRGEGQAAGQARRAPPEADGAAREAPEARARAAGQLGRADREHQGEGRGGQGEREGASRAARGEALTLRGHAEEGLPRPLRVTCNFPCSTTGAWWGCSRGVQGGTSW